MEYSDLDIVYYTDLMNFCVKYIINLGKDDFRRYKEEVYSVNSGSWSGEILFVFTPESEVGGDFLVSSVGYESCALCDTLEGIHNDWKWKKTIDREGAVKEFM